jgi:small multidrug resistance family-3 protein
MQTFFLLLLAAVLEVGGDSLVRIGLGLRESAMPRGVAAMGAGAAVLVAYGFMVNLTKLDFSRLMGQYIVLFFVVAQVIAWVIFKEVPKPSIMVGGALVIAGGVVMAVWHG